MRCALALLSAFLLILSFPPFDHEFLAWVALVPLVSAVCTTPGAPGAFGIAFAFAMAYFMGVFHWINVVDGFGAVDFVLLGIYLGSYIGLWGSTLILLCRRTGLPLTLLAPGLWISLEYLRSNIGFMSLPWALLGHSQYLSLTVLQIASITGAYGISFWIVMVNATVSEILLHFLAGKRMLSGEWPFPRFSLFITLLLTLVSLVYGLVSLSDSHDLQTVTVTVIQGNIPQDLKWDPKRVNEHLEKHVHLTREASTLTRTAMIIWPETSVQGLLNQDIVLRRTISDLARETGVHLLVGASQRPKFGPKEERQVHRTNTAFFISPDGKILRHYDKVRLLPFAEYLPCKDHFPWPSRYVTKTGNFVPGSEFTIFDLHGTRFAVLICWENIFPGLFREFVKNGAEFIVNITNEAWFGETAAPYQFVAMSVLRAVENRIAVVRAANTGVSCFIDPHGRVFAKVSEGMKDVFVEGYMTREIPVARRPTFYTSYGDVFVYGNILFVALLIVWSLIHKRIEDKALHRVAP